MNLAPLERVARRLPAAMPVYQHLLKQSTRMRPLQFEAYASTHIRDAIAFADEFGKPILAAAYRSAMKEMGR
jgi:hypothetical protein